MEPIVYIDRLTGQKCIEKVYGGQALAFLYGDDWLSRTFGIPLLHVLSRTSWFSALYGWWQKRAWTKKKINPFIVNYQIDPLEFREKPSSFGSFNDFFIRKLKPECRAITPKDNVAIIPADARYWFYQNIALAEGFIVKGKKFDISSLLADENLAKKYAQGSMAIARLCPSDYHRYHFPCQCKPSISKLINGYLYSVNPMAVRKNLSIFTQNKRTLCTLETEKFGDVLFLDIGATCVGSIQQTYSPDTVQSKGTEKGYFSFGASCLILLFEQGKIQFDPDLLSATSQGVEIRCLFGQSMGKG